MYEKNNFCHLVMLDWFSIQIFVNFEIFKAVVKYMYFLKYYEAQISFLFVTGNLSPPLKCIRERFNDSLKISKFTGFVWKTNQV